MPTYAKETSVSIDRSRSEIEQTLKRYGATAFMYGWATGRAVIGFEVAERRYRIDIPLPDRSDFARTPSGRRRASSTSVNDAFEQASRQRWRAAALYIKAILEASESGIVAIEEALRNFLVLPDGRTVGEWISPQINTLYQTGKMPPMLPGGNEDEIVDQ
jgi:hypothetical protein